MRSGKFNEQLLEHISNATDIIILLEEESLGSWFNYRSRKESRSVSEDDIPNDSEQDSDFQEEPYKSDWFCREVMFALSLGGKNIIPILLNGYYMPDVKDLPPEMADLSLHNALSLEISEAPEFYEKYFVEQGYLKSKPANLSLARNYQSKGGLVGCFLFYTEVESCDLFECGEKIASLTDDNDEWHPFRYPVNFAGEHRFKTINNDSCDTVTIRCSVDTYCQQYVQIQFSDNRNLWELTQEDIDSHDDADQLYKWGLGLFDGTPKHEPDIALSFECLNKAISLGHQEALSFVCSHGTGLISQKKATTEVAIRWYYIAAKNGNTDAQLNLGHAYRTGQGVKRNYKKAVEWYSKAAEQGHISAQFNLGNMYRKGEGVDQDYAKAIEWYSKVAEQGNKHAMNSLAWTYHLMGDYDKALPWAEKAIEAMPDNPNQGAKRKDRIHGSKEHLKMTPRPPKSRSRRQIRG